MSTRTNERTAEAGRRGSDVRSDCWVKITLADSGGIDLALTSKVESMYGDSIRKLVPDVVGSLAIKDARLEIEDAGALPFVIAARIEAAVARLWHRRSACGLTGETPVPPTGGQYLPEFAPHAQYGTQRDRFRRSRLYLPGNEPKFMLSAGLHGPDGVILDLEDSVAPSVKDEARVLVRNALRTIDFKGAERMVRINQGDRGIRDLDFIVPHNVHIVLIPKVESPEQVTRVDEHVKAILKNNGIDRPVFLMPIVESALGAIMAYEIATASPNVCALTIGLEDYTADIGTQRTNEGRESFWARSQVVNAARAAGVQPIDTVFSDVSDMDALRESVLEAKSLGFDGKGCIHPRQIAVIHEAFAPSDEELEKAKKIVAAFEEAEAKGLGAVSLGNKMIDPPVVKRALRVVELADAMGVAG
ncbi:MAG: aldolase/citrate lyase family protein [Planctomycetota bacterium]